MNLFKIVLLFLLLLSAPAFSQVTEQWVQRYNGTANSFDIVTKLLLDDIGNVYVYGTSNETGHSTDLAVVKYGPGGNLLWSFKYNGSSNTNDQLSDAAIDDEGNSYLTGVTVESDTSRVALLKISSGGTLLWNKSFKGHNGTINLSGRSISLYSQNSLAVLWSELDVSTNKYKPRITYYSASGQYTSEVILSDVLQNVTGSVKIIYDGQGQSLVGLNVIDSASGHTIPKVYNASQNWYQTITGTANASHSFVDMAKDNQDNIIVLAMVVNNGSSQDFRTAKFSPNGVLLWQRDFNGPVNGDDYPFAVSTDAQNNVYVTGFSRSAGIGTEDAVTIKYDENGDIKWYRLFNGAGNGTDQGVTLCVDNDKNVYMGGSTDLGNVKMGYLTIKYDSLGNQSWAKTYSYSQTTPEDFVYSIAVNSAHDVFITGISFSNTTDYDFATIKYSQPIGIQPISNELPNQFSLSQNYPNPFNPNTKIRFEIPNKGLQPLVQIKVFNVLGREIASLVNQSLQPGTYEVNFDATNCPTGIYYYKLTSGDFVETKKMVLIK